MRKPILFITTIILSGAAYFYSIDFHVIWWLMWLAPIPLLIYIRQVNWWLGALAAFIIGTSTILSSVAGYWSSLLPWTSNIMPGIVTALQFSLVFSLTQILQKRQTTWINIFIFPILFSLSEWLLSFTSLGTYPTIAYNQLLFLPVAQIASIGGYIAITFTLSLFASTISFSVCNPQASFKQALIGLTTGFCIVALILLFGIMRLQQPASLVSVKVGLANKTYRIAYTLNPHNALTIVKSYFPLLNHLVSRGAKILIIPEESFLVVKKNQDEIVNTLANYAKNKHVRLIVGVRQKLEKTYNTAWLFSPEGKLITQYRKRHFVPVVEEGLTKGKKLGVFHYDQFKFAMAICRDLDYHYPSASYGELGVNVLFVPAWDFNTDAWVHGRLAYMRGVEYGYTMVRAARDGYLSVTTKTGRFISNRYAANQSGTTLLVNAPIATGNSFYAQHPYLFIIFLLLLLMIIALFTCKN